jgi:hypothetical protein
MSRGPQPDNGDGPDLALWEFGVDVRDLRNDSGISPHWEEAISLIQNHRRGATTVRAAAIPNENVSLRKEIRDG